MGQQRIILIHGRSIKPAKKPAAALQRRALLIGLDRYDPAKAAKVRSGKVKLENVYFGDINNDIMCNSSPKISARLTAKDPDADGAHCLPHDPIKNALDDLEKVKVFNKSTYNKILGNNRDQRFLDDAARAVSTLAALATLSTLNVAAITYATADMGAYLTDHTIGSLVRDRLQAPLRRALLKGDDICLISHSMGCMVAYDVLWKFSRLSEYRKIQDSGNRVTQWLTLGCPLGEAGVKANLLDAKSYGHRTHTDKHPTKIIRTWANVAAKDDFISHDATMRSDYRDMRKFDMLDDIQDRKIYNCYAEDGKSNPHKLYGYLANPACAGLVADWIS